jgi:hypothetical protein
MKSVTPGDLRRDLRQCPRPGEQGDPVNEKYAERRAAAWLYRYRTGKLPPGGPGICDVWATTTS